MSNHFKSKEQMATVQTYSGIDIDLFEPKQDQFRMSDIILSLSQTPKMIGGMERFYSCAQSATIGSHIAEMRFSREIARAYILRYAPACAMGMMNRDLMLSSPGLRVMRDKIGRQTLSFYNVNPDLWMCKEIMMVDEEMMAIEFRDLKPNSIAPLGLPSPNPDIIINPLAPDVAARTFSERCLNDLFSEIAHIIRNDMAGIGSVRSAKDPRSRQACR